MNIRNQPGSARSRIYRCLYQKKGFCSRQDLANELNISMPTVYQNLSSLMESGLVGYSGEHRSTGGRRSSGLCITADARIAIGIYITRTQLRFVAADLLLNQTAETVLESAETTHYLSEGRSLAQPLETFLDEAQIPRDKILGVSLAIPGMLSPDGNILLNSPTMHLRNVPLDGLSEGIPYPFHIENNGTSGGNAELFFWDEHENLACLFLEDGVGGMLHIGGQPYEGDHNRSGEFGHMCVSPGGLKCNCGRYGCLEAYCSNWRISENLGITLDEFFEGVRLHQPDYELLWNDFLQHLAIGINNIHIALDCEVVLSGLMIRYLRPYFPLLLEYTASGNLSDQDTSFLHLGTVEENPAPRGAALYFIRQFVEQI